MGSVIMHYTRSIATSLVNSVMLRLINKPSTDLLSILFEVCREVVSNYHEV